MLPSTERLLLPFHIAWFDTRIRYSRSVLGPFWITIQAGIFVTAVGYLMANIFGTENKAHYLAFLSISYVMWVFLSNVIIESTASFTSATSFIKDRGMKPEMFILVPFARQLIYLGHMLVIPLAAFLITGIGSWKGLVLALPGLLLFFLTALLLTAPVAMICTRFRDGRPIMESAINLLFLVSPILWPPDAVASHARFVLKLNPLAHIFAAWREPLINETFPLESIGFVVLLNAILFGFFLLSLKGARRVALWL